MKKISFLAILLALIMLVCSCGVQPKDNRTVLKLDGKAVCYDYYKYVFLNTRDDLDGGDRSIWTTDYALQLTLSDSVLDTLRFNRAIEILFDKYKLKLTDEEKEAVDGYLDNQKSSLGDNYESSLEEAYLTEYVAKYLYEFSLKWQTLYDYVTSIENGVIECSEETILSSLDEKFNCIYYVMISSEKEDALDIARTVSEKARGCKSLDEFRALIREYGDDDNMLAAIENGYYFVDGEIIEAVEEEVEELNAGEVSDIIDTDLGYFVVMMGEIDTDYVKDNFDTFETKYLARAFNDMVEETSEEIKVDYKDLYSDITVYTLY